MRSRSRAAQFAELEQAVAVLTDELAEARRVEYETKRREQTFRRALSGYKALVKAIVLQRDLRPDAAVGTIQDAAEAARKIGQELEGVLREIFPEEYAEIDAGRAEESGPRVRVVEPRPAEPRTREPIVGYTPAVTSRKVH